MQTIRLLDHGIYPNTDITLLLHELFLKYPSDTEFVFEDSDYYFSPKKEMRFDYRISNSDVTPYRVMAIWMKDMKNCVLSGNGARLWLAGHMQVFTLDHCENIKLNGFTVNWKKPLVAEGKVLARNEASLDVYIDPIIFPHRYSNNILEFDVGADEWYKLSLSAIAFEPHDLTVRRNSGDIHFKEIADLGENVYRMTLKKPSCVEVGDILNLRHNNRIHAGIFSEKCTDLMVENITFYSCGGLGCLAQFCHNLTYRAVHFLTDTSQCRLVSGGRDDGMHITCNSGTVTITECTFHALMDDPINVHGCCVTADEIIDEYTLRCKYRHRQACGFHYWAENGDEIAFIERGNMSRVYTANTASYELDELEEKDTFILRFEHPLPQNILTLAQKVDSLALDNISHTAEFICTKNRFGSCRARGILVSTPKKVIISDNYFESSGAAILVAGDSNHWFESGECNDVEITRNIFTDSCLTSNYQFSEGIISICPVVPLPEIDKPYHKNIRITDNIFDVANTPVLYAYSCTKLSFSRNRILKSPSPDRTDLPKRCIQLKYCTDSCLNDNELIGGFNYSSLLTFENCRNITSNINKSKK